MIKYLYGDELAAHPILRKTMFIDRAKQFSTRLGWDVSVDERGFETDAYDALNPLYVIWQRTDGSHGGSMRFLPTTGPVMVNDHFLHLTDGVTISSPLIWETTRFCLAPDMENSISVSVLLMLAAAEMGRRFHLAHAVGVFDSRMVRVYRAIGWSPDILGQSGNGREAISVGLWDFTAAPIDQMADMAGVDQAEVASWFDQAFHPAQTEAKSA